MSAKFMILKGPSGYYRFNLIASNGQIILSSEQYTTKASTMNAIQSVRLNAPYNATYDRRRACDTAGRITPFHKPNSHEAFILPPTRSRKEKLLLKLI